MHVDEFDVLRSEIEIANGIGKTTNRAYKDRNRMISCR